jgi:uncharacterized protein Yka (UPF0111/DUF47 family)
MIDSLLKQYILPKEVDLIRYLQEHAAIIETIISDLMRCFGQKDCTCCQAILNDEHQAKQIRDRNMNELLNAFITPIDRESIYRVITQLDWIAVSTRHFLLEADAYGVTHLGHTYHPLITTLAHGAKLLHTGFDGLEKEDPKQIASQAQEVRDTYDTLVEIYIKAMAELSRSEDMQRVFVEKELLHQLKEIGKRMQMCANSLEDIVIKMQ